MVNRKSRSANFLQNGSPKKRILDLNSKSKKVSKKAKKKRKIKTKIVWEGEEEYNQVIKNKKANLVLSYTEKIEIYSKINLIGQEYSTLDKYSVSFQIIRNILHKEAIDNAEVISSQDWDLISEYVINKIRLFESNITKKDIELLKKK